MHHRGGYREGVGRWLGGSGVPVHKVPVRRRDYKDGNVEQTPTSPVVCDRQPPPSSPPLHSTLPRYHHRFPSRLLLVVEGFIQNSSATREDRRASTLGLSSVGVHAGHSWCQIPYPIHPRSYNGCLTASSRSTR